MQNVYFAHCKSNVFMAVLFNKSAMCIQLHNVLSTIEYSWSHAAEMCMKAFMFWTPFSAATGFGITSHAVPWFFGSHNQIMPRTQKTTASSLMSGVSVTSSEYNKHARNTALGLPGFLRALLPI